MTATENLFDTTRSFLTPASIQKFSLALNEPNEKIEIGLQTVVPTLVSGLIEEGSTSEGAEKIVKLIEEENFRAEFPQDLNDRKYLIKGENVVTDIFENYKDIASDITPTTGMNRVNVEKMMEMAAPVIMGVIDSKIKNQGMNAQRLNGYFLEQKTLSKRSFGKKKIPFTVLILLLIIGFGGLFWYLSKGTLPVSDMERNLSSLEESVSNPPRMGTSRANGPTLKDLPRFLQTGKTAELPKRFSISNVTFEPGSTDFGPGGDEDLNLIARTMKRYPGAIADVEAFIEDTGDPEENLLLSENRAMLLREELIGRGIEPSRINAEGRGPMVNGHQLYFVIKQIK